MRTTLALDDDVAAKLRAFARRSGWSFRDVVNEALRQGLAIPERAARQPFKVAARDLGNLRPGLTIDSVADLLDRLEGPLSR